MDKQLQLNELQTGMLVRCRGGYEAWVMLGTKNDDILVSTDKRSPGYLRLEAYDINLMYTDTSLAKSEWDIMEVKKSRGHGYTCIEAEYVIFTRVEVVELTVDEVSDRLGYEVKIVGGA